MVDFDPTAEQRAAADLFRRGETMVLEAGAGTGKTATLQLLAEQHDGRGQYVAFNTAIVRDAATRFPENVTCRTMHSLAFGAVGYRFKRRLGGPRVKGWEIARRLDGLDTWSCSTGNGKARRLDRGYLAGLVMKAITRFCNSDDVQPTKWHVPYVEGLDMPTAQGHRQFRNNDALREYLEPFLAQAWADLSVPTGVLPFKHEHYLKLWELSDPKIPVEFILFDEAQDAAPVMASIVGQQQDTQVVYVGDSQQAIYEWRGAVNALDGFDAEHRRFLTQSFRFGQPIADVANLILGLIPGAQVRLVGAPGVVSTVGEECTADAYLARTNAGVFDALFRRHARGEKVHLLGGSAEIASFARSALALQAGGRASHHDLVCFDSWGEVVEYVESDPHGDELALMVGLVEEYGPEKILQVVDQSVPESAADVVVSTVHKAKGREWSRVKLGEDFVLEPSVPEWRLLYVATTRAKHMLDDRATASQYRRR